MPTTTFQSSLHHQRQFSTCHPGATAASPSFSKETPGQYHEKPSSRGSSYTHHDAVWQNFQKLLGGIKSCKPLVSPKTAPEAMTAFFRLPAFGHNVSGLGSPKLRCGSHQKPITMTIVPNKKSITLHTTASQTNQRGPPQNCWTK